MHKIITLEETLKKPHTLYIDVRSPSEFSTGHIPNAINIPIFSDEERVKVGTLYKQVGVEEAKELGLTIASGKLPEIVRQVRSLYKAGHSIVLYCWRGGMRSKSLVTILTLMGLQVSQLSGGYKGYRRYVLDSLLTFKVIPKMIVLSGSTGVGKTSLLKLLHAKNIPVIDLEKLANHRGSVFGQIGLGQATTAHSFDAAILTALKELTEAPYIVVECESKRIGNVYLPECLYQGMKEGIKILVHADIETRISRLIDEYTDLDEENSNAIILSIKALTKKFGAKKINSLVSDFTKGQLRSVVHTLLVDYYDPLYGYDKSDDNKYSLTVNCNDLEDASLQIITYLEQLKEAASCKL